LTHILIEIMESHTDENSVKWRIVKKKDLGKFVKSKITEYNSELDKITLNENQKARIHKCFHDNNTHQPCEIIGEKN
tara:strand:+ start:575 stop:805 length:231 start_codon:yes stop_codon:yes gene_type:complete